MIAEAALQCDVISHETTFDVSMLERALRSGHSTTHMHVPSLSLVRLSLLLVPCSHDSPHTGRLSSRIQSKRLI
jgi:hypothetical protein